jgi:hypothetical protein
VNTKTPSINYNNKKMMKKRTKRKNATSQMTFKMNSSLLTSQGAFWINIGGGEELEEIIMKEA